MTISPLLADAKSAHHAGDLERAITGYRSVLEGGPDAATSNLLAIALDGSGRADEAESVLARAHEMEPDLADPALNLARLRLRRGAVEEAVPPLRRAGTTGSQEALALLFEVACAAGLHADVLNTGRRLLADGSLQAQQAERLGEIAFRTEAEDAPAILENAVRRFPDSARLHLLMAHHLGRHGTHDAAVTAFRRSQCLNPADLDAVFNAARILDLSGQNSAASRECNRALAIAPGWPDALLLCARIEALHGSPARARALAAQALAALPTSAKAHAAFALARFAGGEKEAAIAGHRRALLLDPADAMEWNDRGVMLKQVGTVDDADLAYGRARTVSPDLLPAIKNHAALLFDMTDMEAAADAYDHALRIAPDDAGLAMKRAMTFPTILRSEAEIDAIRADIERRMLAIKHSGMVMTDPLKEVGRPNFYLAYHGRNDRGLQTLIAETYLALCPALGFVAPHCRSPKARSGGKLKIGFLSKFFYDHSVKFISEGIIRNLDPALFEVHLISTMEPQDVDIFPPGQGPAGYTRIEEDLFQAQQDIAALELDILVFGDIGMEPLSYYLGFARFAPVQCVMQGHPVTTGLPHMDYFVCSALQEIEGAEAHYTEMPIRVKDIPLCYPDLPEVPDKRLSYFGLPEDRTLYFCPQTLFKFHPDFDSILKGILEGDPDGMLVLLKDRQETRNRQLEARLSETLGDLTQRIHWVGRLPKLDYYALLKHSAAMLDTTHFCGGNTTIQALGLGIPPITLPADYVRGRMTIGWLKAIDVMELVADTPDDYVRITLACGTDPAWRAKVVAKIEARKHELFENQACVRELEEFFPEAYDAALRGERLRWISGRHMP
ncbi:tetratricopeptide repeat protein [Nisaea denitrificans]|uniref:O-linked N-acetylglucosamine transferase family protein n=1 Tax=Nisaea denitrificans TaxID=390877 RepID=UPI0004039281|nr:tetratricopeptide repeat protein [Nisaea denitrificans]